MDLSPHWKRKYIIKNNLKIFFMRFDLSSLWFIFYPAFVTSIIFSFLLKFTWICNCETWKCCAYHFIIFKAVTATVTTLLTHIFLTKFFFCLSFLCFSPPTFWTCPLNCELQRNSNFYKPRISIQVVNFLYIITWMWIICRKAVKRKKQMTIDSIRFYSGTITFFEKSFHNSSAFTLNNKH